MMDFWTPTSGSWADDFQNKNMPYYTKYDYVQVETYNETTGGFDLLWKDEFKSFDSDRWLKSDGWGSGDNCSTVYYPSQVYTEHSMLVFKMEKNGWSEEE